LGSVLFLLFCEYKRQTSTQAQIGRFLEKIVNLYWSEKSFFLQAYKLGLEVFFGTSAEQKISEATKVAKETLETAATSGNSKADQVISEIKSLTNAVKALAEEKSK
jgi:hypothetical protein